MGTHKPWFSDEDYNVEDYKNDYEKFIGMTGLLDRFFKKIY